MVKQLMILTQSVCYHYSGMIPAAVISAIRSGHLIEILVQKIGWKNILMPDQNLNRMFRSLFHWGGKNTHFFLFSELLVLK